MASQSNKRPREQTADEPTAKRPSIEHSTLPTFLVMDIIHMMPLAKIVEMYEEGGQRIPVKTMARLLDKVLTFPRQLRTNLTGVSKSFTVGKYRIDYEEHGEDCVDGTFSHAFTDYITSFYDGDHRFYMNRFRKSSKQRLNFAWLLGNGPEPEIVRTVEEEFFSYERQPVRESVPSSTSQAVPSRFPVPRRSPFAVRA
jgi:hypothetical protein